MASNTKLKLIDLDVLEDAAECLRTLAHPVRLRMVQMMLHQEYTVGELAKACEIRSHVASEHLRLMQRCHFLGCRREGRRKYYQVVETQLASLMQCIEEHFDDP